MNHADTIHTPVAQAAHTPTAAHYNDEPSLRLDVSAAGTKKEGVEIVIATDKNGRPLVKFFKWHMTRKQRILLISGLVVLLLAVILLIGFLVIIPAVIQHIVNNAGLTVNYLDVKSIPSDSVLTVELSLNVQHDVGIAASTDDITATLFYAGDAVGTVVIPGLDIKTGHQNYNLTVKGDLTLVNLDAFNRMAEGLVKNAEISLDAKSSIKAHAIGLTFGGLELKRTLTINGFNQFSDPAPKINYIDWFGCVNDVYQMDINVTLFNPADMGLDGIGALNLSLYYGDSYLGYAESLKPELGLPRGPSEQIFRATVAHGTPALKEMGMGVITNSAQFSISGDNPFSTKYTQFTEAIRTVNMSVLYTDGLSNLKFNQSCNILSLLA